MKNKELISNYYELAGDAERGIQKVSFTNIQNFKLNWIKQKNIDKLESEVKTLTKTIEGLKSEEYSELRKEIEEFVKNEINKEIESNPNMSQSELNKLDLDTQKKYEKYEEYNKLQKEFNKQVTALLDSDNDFQYHKIKFEEIKDLPLNDEQVRAVKYMIED